MQTLEDRIQEYGSAVKMLRSSPLGHWVFPFQPQFSNWRDEQQAWADNVVFFDQSFHMDDRYFEGRDVKRLFSDVAVNDFSRFGMNKANQVIAVTPDGKYIGDSICFGFGENRYSIVGGPLLANWLEYNAKMGDYDVEITLDPRSEINPNARKLFRFQVQGPKALDAIRRAAGGSMPEIKFFNIGEFEIAGVPVRALNHTMAGVPGHEHTGLEITGDFAQHGVVYNAIIEAGREFDLHEGGSVAYPTTCLESGWVSIPVPAIYSGDGMKAYRQHLSANTLEGHASLGGSFLSDDIDDYYYTPWDLGLGRTVKFTHDFIGREALERSANEPRLRKVRLEWNNDDALRLLGRSLFADDSTRTKYMNLPLSTYTIYQVDKVMAGDTIVGRSEYTGYLSTARKFVSIGLVDEQHAVSGTELTVVWGNAGDNPSVEKHAPCAVRVTVDANAFR